MQRSTKSDWGSACRSPRLLARLIIDDRVSPAHILLSPPQLRQLGLGPHRRVACFLKARHQPASSLPLAVVLHPIRELRPGVHRQLKAEVDLQGLSRDELRSFFVAWLASQATPVPEAQPDSASAFTIGQALNNDTGATPGEVTPNGDAELGSAAHGRNAEAPAVALETGSMLSVQSADGKQKSSFFLELTWQAAAPKDSHLMLQSPQAFLQSGVPVEMGPGVELPASSKADKASWQGRSPQSATANHSAAAEGLPASSGAGAPLHVSGQRQEADYHVIFTAWLSPVEIFVSPISGHMRGMQGTSMGLKIIDCGGTSLLGLLIWGTSF